jgi:hypothetical protein
VTLSKFLPLVEALLNEGDRASTARHLAENLNAKNLIFFIKDPIIGISLPAPGFPQTLPESRKWRQLLFDCQRNGQASSEALPSPYDQQLDTACAFQINPHLILSLIGPLGEIQFSHELKLLFSLLTVPFRNERIAQNAEVQRSLANDLVLKTKNLALALEKTRCELQRALSQSEERHIRLLDLFRENRSIYSDKEEVLALTGFLVSDCPIGIAWIMQDLRLISMNSTLSIFLRVLPSRLSKLRFSDVLPVHGAEIEKLAQSVLDSRAIKIGRKLEISFPGLGFEKRLCVIAGYPVQLGYSGSFGVGIILVDMTDHKLNPKSRDSFEDIKTLVSLLAQHLSNPELQRRLTDRVTASFTKTESLMNDLLRTKKQIPLEKP